MAAARLHVIPARAGIQPPSLSSFPGPGFQNPVQRKLGACPSEGWGQVWIDAARPISLSFL